MANWKSRWGRPAGAVALAVAMALAGAVPFPGAPGALAAAKEEKPTLSPEVQKKLKAAQDAMQKEDWDTMLALSTEALGISVKPYDKQQSLTMIRFADGKKKDFAAYADATEQLNALDIVPDSDRIPSYKTLAQIYTQLKQYDKAVAYATKWADNGGGYEANTLLWQLYLTQKDCEHGVVVLEKAVAGRDPTEQELRQENFCYYQLKDEAKREAVMDQLVVKYPKADYFYDLRLIFRDQKMDNTAMFDVLRLIYSKGYMTRESEFVEYADKAIDLGAPAEALEVLNKGIEAGAVKLIASTDHNSMQLAAAKQQSAEDRKQIDKEAATTKNGEGDVKVGLAYLGLGQYDKAVAAIRRGLAPDRVDKVKRVDQANMDLGIALLKLGKKDEAVAAFTAAKADPRMAKAADLWLSTLQ
jgi:tetratricopeptide (TPR) repeat protein